MIFCWEIEGTIRSQPGPGRTYPEEEIKFPDSKSPGLKHGSDDLKPGSPNLKTGSTDLKPGSLNPKPGSVDLKPGSIDPKPGSIVLEPESPDLKPGSADPQLRGSKATLRFKIEHKKFTKRRV